MVCDTCGAAACNRCIPGFNTIPKPELDSSTFKCVRCTGRRTIFHVSQPPIYRLVLILDNRDYMALRDHLSSQRGWWLLHTACQTHSSSGSALHRSSSLSSSSKASPTLAQQDNSFTSPWHKPILQLQSSCIMSLFFSTSVILQNVVHMPATSPTLCRGYRQGMPTHSSTPSY